MKKVVIIILALAPIICMGQFRERPPSAFYLSYQPTDNGTGARFDYHFNHWAGLYSSASYGSMGLYHLSGLGQHVKASMGILIPYKDYMGNQFDWSVGLNYHWVSGEVEPSCIFEDNPQFHKPWSFELGLVMKMRRVCIGMRTDILRWEPCIDVGIPL
jgi:hypothetical protein